MGTNKLVEKLEEYLGLSEGKQRKKHDKLVEIIRNLEENKSSLEDDMQKEMENNANSSRYQDLKRELEVISGLISKAKQKNLPD